MSKRYPIKFLEAYTRADKDVFFGRQEEIDALYEMVFQADLLLIYGASGTGKTSLIQCGLANRFEPYDWMPVSIRRGKNLNQSLEDALKAIAGGSTSEAIQYDWFSEDTADTDRLKLPKTDLEQTLHRIFLQYFKPIYLIFDQFEELYILGSKAEQQAFYETVREILRVEQPVKIILSIREEYLGHLYEFERAVPELLRKKLRVEPMHLDKIKTVVQQIGSLPDSNIRLEAGKEDAIATRIFEAIRGEEKTLSIQLPYLQVFLDRFYLDISGDDSRQAEATFTLSSLQKMGKIDNVLRAFLDDQVLHIARTQGQTPEALWAVLSPFVTLESTKDPLSLDELHQRLPDYTRPQLQRTVEAFQQARILRYREDEAVYEIMHDSLAGQIANKRTDEEVARLEVERLISSQMALQAEQREYFSEKQLEFIEPFRAELRLTEEERVFLEDSRAAVEEALRKKRNERRRRIGAVLFALVAMAGLTIWALLKQQEAIDAKNDALRAQAVTVQALKQVTRTQRIRIAKELETHGQAYQDLNKYQDARETYKIALDSLYGDTTIILYEKLLQKIELLQD